MKLFLFISQKIKNLIKGFKKHFLVVRVRPKVSETSKIKIEQPKKEEPKRVPLNESNVKYALEYVLKVAEDNDVNLGVGILLGDSNDLCKQKSFTKLICTTFKYVTIYTDDIYAADKFGDYVYDKYGLPIMAIGSSEFLKCRYHITIDLVSGKLRCGRDMCIDGALYDKSEHLIGITSGKRIIKV